MLPGLIAYVLVASLASPGSSTSPPSSPGAVETTVTAVSLAGTTSPAVDLGATATSTASTAAASTASTTASTASTASASTASTASATAASTASTTAATAASTTVRPCGVPGYVPSLKVSPSTFSLKVTWAQPVNSNASCIQYYSVCLWGNICNSTNNTELTIDELPACTAYNISVTVFEAGVNSPSVIARQKTLPAVPGKVGNMQATAEASRLNVKWTEPSENASCVEYYSVCWGNDCNHTTNTELTIDGLSACTDYNISVTAVGEAGNSSAAFTRIRTLAAVPGNVANLQVVPSTFSLTATWTAPSLNTACIKSYSVCWEDVCNSTVDTELTIDGLPACTQYNINVTVVGEENKSPSVKLSTNTLAAVPGEISHIELINHNTSSMEITWDAPTENPACALSYELCWRDTSSYRNDYNCIHSYVTSYTLESLQPCSNYDVSIKAVGSANSSSAVYDLLATQDAVPDSISNITVIEWSTSWLQIEWDEPRENSVCVVKYEVCWQDTKYTENRSHCLDSSSTNATIDNLEPCSSYNISIKAGGRNGSYSAIDSEIFDTENAVPESIRKVVKVNSSTSSLQLEWDEPSVNPTCVLNYLVCWQDTSASEWQCSYSESTNYTVTDLQPCSTYNISVTAEGEMGDSSSTQDLFDTRDAVPEGIAKVVNVNSSTSSLQLEWDEPSVNPTCVLNYSVCWQDTSASEWQCSYSESTNYTVTDLQPCSTYNISVTAEGEKGNSSSTQDLFDTHNAVPGSVLELDVQPSHTALEVNWIKPSVNAACAKSYKVCWGVRIAPSDYSCDNTGLEQLGISNLLPCTQYRVLVAAVGPEESSQNELKITTTLSLVPDNIPNIALVNSSATSLQFEWDEPVENPTCVQNYSVCWQDVTSDSTAPQCEYSDATSFTMPSLQPCSSYNVTVQAEGSEGPSSPVYVVSGTHESEPGPPRNLSRLGVGVWNATVGWAEPDLHPQCVARYGLSWEATAPDGGSNSSATVSTNFTIVDLRPESSYNVAVSALTRGGLQSQRIYLVVVTLAEPQNMKVVIGATVCSVLLLSGIVICGIYSYRKGILVWPPWAKSPLKRKSLTHREIPIKDFRSYCDQLLSTPARLQSEYQLLITLCADYAATMTTNAGHEPDNKKKNRYINVIPYDATRVKLETDNKGMSDYINSSYIKGYSGSVEYIATQGPKEDTCEDFWNMVFQQNVQLIIMLTQFEENEKVKCFRYFPGLRGNVKYGSITVHCATEMMFPIYTQRTFTVYKDGRKKTVKHLHFREWPDFGCPDNTDVMLEFCQVGRQNTENRDSPTVVHCSAGVGRTGTYIAVDILLQHIKDNKKVDIFNTVYKLRQHRVNMVQSEAQYVYIYQCIKDALDDESIMNTEKSSSNHSLEPIYENIGLTINNSSYEILPKESKKAKKNNNNNSSHM